MKNELTELMQGELSVVDLSSIRKVGAIEGTNAKAVFKDINKALENGWILLIIRIFWNNGVTKYTAIVGIKEEEDVQ